MRVETMTDGVVLCVLLVFLITTAGSGAFVLISNPNPQQAPTISVLQTSAGGEQFVQLPLLRQDSLLQLLMFLAQRGFLIPDTPPAQTPSDNQAITSRLSFTEGPLRTAETTPANNITHLNSKEPPTLQDPEVTLPAGRTITEALHDDTEESEEPVATEDDLAPDTTEVPIAMTTEKVPAPEESVAATTESFEAEEEETADASPATNVSSSTEDVKVEVQDLQATAAATTPSPAEEEAEEGAETDLQNPATDEPEVEENPAVTDGEIEAGENQEEEEEEEEEEPPAIFLSFGGGNTGRLHCVLSDGRCMRSCPNSGDVIPGASCGSDAQGHALVCCDD